jgi:hypothetical protein
VRTVCPGLCVLRFKYLAALTRRTTVTAVGTGLPNHCLHRATGSISSTLSFPHSCIDELDCYYLKNLTEDFLNFLNPNSSVPSFFTCFILFSRYLCSVYASFHHDDYATALLCMHLSTLSAACISSPSNFLK